MLKFRRLKPEVYYSATDDDDDDDDDDDGDDYDDWIVKMPCGQNSR